MRALLALALWVTLSAQGGDYEFRLAQGSGAIADTTSDAFVTRRELDQRLDAFKSLVDQTFESSQRAVELASDEQNLRNIVNNEFRGQLKDQAATFVTKDALAAMAKSIDERINALQIYRANIEGRLWAIGAVFTVVNLLLVVYGAWRTSQPKRA